MFKTWVHPVNAYLYYYFAVIASPSETVGAAIPGGAEKVKSWFTTVTPMAWFAGCTALRQAQDRQGFKGGFNQPLRKASAVAKAMADKSAWQAEEVW